MLLNEKFDVLEYYREISKTETTITNFVTQSSKIVQDLNENYMKTRKDILDPLTAFIKLYPAEIVCYLEWKALNHEYQEAEMRLQARVILKSIDPEGQKLYDQEKRIRDVLATSLASKKEQLGKKFDGKAGKELLKQIEQAYDPKKEKLDKEWKLIVETSGLQYKESSQRKVLEIEHWKRMTSPEKCLFQDCDHIDLKNIRSKFQVVQKNLRFLPKKRNFDLEFSHSLNDEEWLENMVNHLRIEIMEVNIYLSEQISVQESLKQLENMKSTIKDLQKENEDLKKLVTIVELRYRLEGLVKERINALNLNISSPTDFLKQLSDPSNLSLSQEWLAIVQTQLQNCNNTRIRAQIAQLYGQLSGEIHDPKHFGFDDVKRLKVDSSHIGNNRDRYLALQILLKHYGKDSSLYDAQNGPIQKQDIDFQ